MTSLTQDAKPMHPTTEQVNQTEGLQSLYVRLLREMYNGENQIVQALTVMTAAATSPQLKQGFVMHQQQSQTQAERVEQILQSLGQNPNGMMSKGIYALIGEGQMLIKQKMPGALLDAGLIAVAQHVEHYEISAYGTLRSWAQALGRQQDISLIEQSLQEEKQTDEKLTQVAEQVVNQTAAKA